MRINRFYTIDDKFYDADTGIIFDSDSNINQVIDKINEGYTIDNINNAFEDQDIDAKSILMQLEETVLNRFKLSSNYMESTVNKVMPISQEDWNNKHIAEKLCLLLTQKCNMKCEYCYAHQGVYDKESIMDEQTAKETIDFFFNSLRSDVRKVEIDLFGGEPLLNKSVFIFAINYINEKCKLLNLKPHYLLTTNCTLLDDNIIDIIKKNNISVTVSIDGDQQSYDLNRKFNNGAASFEIVVNNIKKLINQYTNVTARMTLTKPTIQAFEENVRYLWKLGLHCIYIDLVETEDISLAITQEDLDIFEIQLKHIADLMYENKINSVAENDVISNLIFIIQRLVNRKVRHKCFLYSLNRVICNPAGDIYHCLRTIGNHEYCIGNIADGIKLNIIKENKNNLAICQECWAKRLCGGACDIKGLSEVNCRFKKILIENAIRLYIHTKRV